MGQFELNSCCVGWPKNYLFIKQVIQVNTNLIKTYYTKPKPVKTCWVWVM